MYSKERLFPSDLSELQKAAIQSVAVGTGTEKGTEVNGKFI